MQMAMTLDFTLDRQVITRIDSNRVVAGSKGYVAAHFTDVRGDWTAPTTAIFGAYAVLLDDNMGCTVPWEVLADPGVFEVSAFCGDLHTANTARVDVEATGYKRGETPADPTPDVYAVLVEKARHAEQIAQSVRDDADAGKFDGADGKTPVRGVDYWTEADRKPIEDAILAATTAAGRADAAAATATEGEKVREVAETERADAEAARAEAELARRTAETGRVEAEATRATNESQRTETFNTNLSSWNGKVDAACKKATDTANKAAQDAKTATDAAIAKTEEATNAAVAKAQTATDNATVAANKAESAVAQLPLPLGNTLKGEVEATSVNVDDAYPAPLVTAKVMGQSNQRQDPAPSPENPQEITNLNKAELVITGRNIVEQSITLTDAAAVNQYSSCLFVEAHLMPSTNYVLSFNDVVGNGYYTNENLFSNYSAFTTKSGRNVVKLSTKAEISKANMGQYVKQGWIILKNDKNQDKAPAFTNVQIELGDTVTVYEPYQSKRTPIDLQGNELQSIPNGVRDEVVIDADGNVSLIKRVAKYVVPENVYAQNESNNFGVKLDLNAVDDKYLHRQLCPENAPYSPIVNWLSVYKKNGNWANLQEFKQWLIGTEFYYGTKNPETIPLGKVELPALPESTSNVWNNGNIQTDVYVQYLKDVNIAYGKLESQLSQITMALSMIDTPTVIPEI